MYFKKKHGKNRPKQPRVKSKKKKRVLGLTLEEFGVLEGKFNIKNNISYGTNNRCFL